MPRGRKHPTKSDDEAFPTEVEYGLTKREWFAGQALAGLTFGRREDVTVFAREAAHVADAVIAALNKEPEK